MQISKQQSSLLVYTILVIITATNVIATAAGYDVRSEDLLEKADASNLFSAALLLIGATCVALPLYSYLRAYALARKIFAKKPFICLTAEDILLLEKKYSFKQISHLCLGSEDGKPIIEALRRHIVFSNSVKH